MNNLSILSLSLLISVIISCDSSSEKENNQTGPVIETTQDKSRLEAYYELPHMKEWYTKRILPPAFDFNMDISKKTPMELRLLKNEMYARNGYLFDEADLRGYFNQFDWYQPVFDVPDFKIQLNDQELAFVQKVEALEKQLQKQKYTKVNGQPLIRTEHVVNLMQFESLDKSFSEALKKNNFALVRADHEQLFYVYDENQYEYIPNFITTDLYIQTLHLYLSSQLKEIEEEKLMATVKRLLTGLYKKAKSNENERTTGNWTTTYLAVALTALTGDNYPVAPEMAVFYNSECANIKNENMTSSDFLETNMMDYSQFRPRGNYTSSESLKNYFKSIKWLNMAAMKVRSDVQLKSALQLAFWIKNDPALRKDYTAFNQVIQLLAGDEDNASIDHLIQLIEKNGIRSKDQLLQQSTVDKLKKAVTELKVSKINPSGSSAQLNAELNEPTILFTAGRYSFDGEIYSKLIHVMQPQPKRAYPKSLDLFAVFGNTTAESILLNTYKEQQEWPEYTTKLNQLKKQFKGYNNWDNSIFTKMMDGLFTLTLPSENTDPLFMKTESWRRKNLNTSLAAYTQMKHDLVLYAEQPMAAEAGQGGGPPPPKKRSYVEPNVRFWKKAIALLDFQREKLKKLQLLTKHSAEINSDLKELAQFLLKISEKEIKKEQVNDKEFERMDWLGGEIERITFNILQTDHLPERDKQIALIADVYTYNQSYLQSGVGLADEIYVIAEINGLPYLTRGACFSYYEFVSNRRLTDEEWQNRLQTSNRPKSPSWISELYANCKPLKSRPEYSF